MSRRIPDLVYGDWIKRKGMNKEALASGAIIVFATRNVHNRETFTDNLLRLAEIVVLPKKITIIVDFVDLVSVKVILSTLECDFHGLGNGARPEIANRIGTKAMKGDVLRKRSTGEHGTCSKFPAIEPILRRGAMTNDRAVGSVVLYDNTHVAVVLRWTEGAKECTNYSVWSPWAQQ